MKILINDLAAESSGALKILESVYNNISECENDYFYLMTSVVEFKQLPNLKLLRYPKAKKSIFMRIYYDMVETKRLINKYDIDIYISLQNTMFTYGKCFNVLYIQQSLQYLDSESFYLKKAKNFWFRKEIIGKLINLSATKADKVYVQTEWMKRKVAEHIKENKNKVKIVKPYIDIDTEKYKYKNNKGIINFFYPAAPSAYKNHSIIIKAAKLLVEEGNSNFKIIFTFNENSDYATKLMKEYKNDNIPVEFVGNLSYENVLEFYTKSVLIFTSEIETVGLPLIEMMTIGGPIIVSDKEYAHNVIGDYNNAVFVQHNEANLLKETMKKYITGEIKCNHSNFKNKKVNLLKDIIREYYEYIRK